MHVDGTLAMPRLKPGYYLDARSTGREEAWESLAQKQKGPCTCRSFLLSASCVNNSS
jgi:hypothetical protein